MCTYLVKDNVTRYDTWDHAIAVVINVENPRPIKGKFLWVPIPKSQTFLYLMVYEMVGRVE